MTKSPKRNQTASQGAGKTSSRAKSARVPTALQAFPSLPDDALVGIRVVGGLIDKGPSSVWRDVRGGKLPVPVKMGGSTRWRVGDLRQVLAAAKTGK